MAKYTWYFQVDNIKLKAKCKICTTLAILKFSSTSKTKPFETAHRYVRPEEAADAVDLLPLHTAFQGPPTFSGQDATTDSIVYMIIDFNLPVSIVGKPSFRKSYRTASGGKLQKKDCDIKNYSKRQLLGFQLFFLYS